MYVFGGTSNELDYDDVWALTLTTGEKNEVAEATVSATNPVTAPPRKKPVAARPAPAPTPAPVSGSSSASAVPAKYTPTSKPDVDYKTATPAPAQRRLVTAPKLQPVSNRDFEAVHERFVSDIGKIFDHIRAEYQQIDTARAQLNADRQAFDQEKADNEDLFRTQQEELRQLKERHRKETEQWLADRGTENDEERRKIAEEKALLAKENTHLKKETERLLADRTKLDEEEAAFQDKSAKFAVLMQQFKGIT